MKLSVITINFNNRGGLQKTIDSVINQSFPNFEYIIIDGGSTDGSVEVIHSYSEKLTSWISEIDKGVYDAMNKGVTVATGDYLIFLNSGDTFVDIYSLENLYYGGKEKDIVYGDLLIKDSSEEFIKTYPSVLKKEYFKHESLPHPAMLIKRELFRIVGFYDLRFNICSDWFFYLKAIFNFKCSYQYVPKTISTFNLDGISSDIKNRDIVQNERRIIWDKIFPFDKYLAFFSRKALKK